MPKRNPGKKYGVTPISPGMKNLLVGKGIVGLGPSELNKRVKQQQALAQKAFGSNANKDKLTASDVANVYRGLKHEKLAQDMKDMKKLKDQGYFG
jgi:hypothetical protein